MLARSGARQHLWLRWCQFSCHSFRFLNSAHVKTPREATGLQWIQDSQSPKLDPKERIYALHCPFASIGDCKPALNSDSLDTICAPQSTEPMKRTTEYWCLRAPERAHCALRSAQHLWCLGCCPFPSPSSDDLVQIPREVAEYTSVVVVFVVVVVVSSSSSIRKAFRVHSVAKD